jgi:hypothetical protein
VSPVKYELGFYIPEDDNLHSHRRENLKSYLIIVCTNVCMARALNACPIAHAHAHIPAVNVHIHRSLDVCFAVDRADMTSVCAATRLCTVRPCVSVLLGRMVYAFVRSGTQVQGHKAHTCQPSNTHSC